MGSKRVHPRQKANHRMPRHRNKHDAAQRKPESEDGNPKRDDSWLGGLDDFADDILEYGDYGNEEDDDW